jgi:hypothetical protein
MDEQTPQTPQEIISVYQDLSLSFQGKKEVLDDLVHKFQNQIAGLRSELSELENKLKSYEMYKMPKVFLMEVEDKARGKKYVRAVVRFYTQGKQKQQSTTIYLGKLADFPFGLEDLRLKELAEIKAIEVVQRIQSKENSL